MPDAAAPMDTEAVVCAAHSASDAVGKLLNLTEAVQAFAQGELREIARDLGEALHAVLSFMPEPAAADAGLLAALETRLNQMDFEDAQ